MCHLPLHKCTDDVIQFLVHSWPESCQVSTRNGNLSLHVALHEKLSLKAIQVLVQAWPDAIHEHDNKGRLPLHLALLYGCADEVIVWSIHGPNHARFRQRKMSLLCTWHATINHQLWFASYLIAFHKLSVIQYVFTTTFTCRLWEENRFWLSL